MECGNEEIDFHHERFSLVVEYTVLKLILCIALQKNWLARHLDFENAFQNRF